MLLKFQVLIGVYKPHSWQSILIVAKHRVIALRVLTALMLRTIPDNNGGFRLHLANVSVLRCRFSILYLTQLVVSFACAVLEAMETEDVAALMTFGCHARMSLIPILSLFTCQ
jgi:hypothetical protein